MPPRSISDEFNDSYAEQGLQPSTGRREVISYVRRESSAPSRVGKKTKGQVTQATGKGVSKAGMALSRTGVGAIVGVPLVVAGKALQVKGKGQQVNAKATGGTTPSSLRIARTTKTSLPGIMGKADEVKDRIKATRVSMMIMSWGMPVWFGLQLPLALLYTVFFGFSGNVTAAIDYVTSLPVLAPIGAVGNFITNATGVNLDPAQLASQLSGGVLEVFASVVFFIGMMTLIAMGFIYVISGISCLFGEGAHVKIPAFIFAIFGYFMPFLSIFPWFLLWALAVWRYPK